MTRRGYGSHSFLTDYIRENEVSRIMEIGVHSGENARNMVDVASESVSREDIEYYGFDYFENRSRLENVREKLSKTGCQFELFKGDSIDVLPDVVDRLPKMDLIFIDGGHDFETVSSDWEHSRKLMRKDTAVFFHNYNYEGTGRVVDSISRDVFSVEIFNPANDYESAVVKRKEG